MKVLSITQETADFPVIYDLACMMRMLKHETEPGRAVDEIEPYIDYMLFKLKIGAIIYYIPMKGFIMLDHATDMLLKEPHKSYFMMSHIFIKPEFRKTRAYAALFYRMLKEIDGQIIGLTYKNSEHNAVLQKRYKVLGTIYGRYE